MMRLPRSAHLRPAERITGGATEVIGDGEPAICAVCGAPRVGSFCAGCGQRVLHQRHTLRGLIGGAFERLFNLESGLTHTVIRLTVDPGGVVRDYLAGRMVVYMHPVAYVTIAFAAFALAFRWTEGTGGGTFERVSTGAIPVFLAAASRIVFWRDGLNYAEHLILSMFLFAQTVVFLAGALMLAYVMPASARLIVFAVAVAVACAYMLWSYARVFPRCPKLALMGGLFVLILGMSLWGGAVATVVRLASEA